MQQAEFMQSALATPSGIEALKKAAKLGIDLGKQIETASKDGWQVLDILQFVDEFATAAEVFKSGAELLEELKTFNEEGKQELFDYIAEEFDIANDKIEGIVESSLSIALSLVSLINQLRA